MGWISYLFVAVFLLGPSPRTTSGQIQDDTDPLEFKETQERFTKAFVKNVINAPQFGIQGKIDFIEVTEALTKAIQLLREATHADGEEREALMYAFAAGIAELIAEQCDENLGIVEKTSIITNALQNAYLETSGHPNYGLLREVKMLVITFLTIDNMSPKQHLEPLAESLEFENFGLPEGFNQYGQIGGFEPPGPPKFNLYYLNGTELPPERVQAIRRRHQRFYNQPRLVHQLIPFGGSPSVRQGEYQHFPLERYPNFQHGRYTHASQFPESEEPLSPMSPQGARPNGSQFPRENPPDPSATGPQGTHSLRRGGNPQRPFSPQVPMPGPQNGKPESPLSPQGPTPGTADGKPKSPISLQGTSPDKTGGKPKSPLSPQELERPQITEQEIPGGPGPEETTSDENPFSTEGGKTPQNGKPK